MTNTQSERRHATTQNMADDGHMIPISSLHHDFKQTLTHIPDSRAQLGHSQTLKLTPAFQKFHSSGVTRNTNTIAAGLVSSPSWWPSSTKHAQTTANREVQRYKPPILCYINLSLFIMIQCSFKLLPPTADIYF